MVSIMNVLNSTHFSLPERLFKKFMRTFGLSGLENSPHRTSVMKGDYIIWLWQSPGILIRSLSVSGDRYLFHTSLNKKRCYLTELRK